MHEVKFRAYDKITKMIVPVWEIGWKAWHGSEINYIKIKTEKDGTVDRLEHEVELLQFTGLKDCKGIEIYEEDIVKCVPNDWSELIADPPDLTRDASTVEYFHGMFHLCQKYHGREPIEDYLDGMNDNDWDEWTFLEVIGNIYETPELLEKE